MFAGDIVTTGRTLDREAAAVHALEVSVSDGELSGTARVRVTLTDINDHAPAFTQRFYDVRVPPHVTTQRDAPSPDVSAEADTTDAEEDEEGSGRLSWDFWDDDPSSDYVYVTTVTLVSRK